MAPSAAGWYKLAAGRGQCDGLTERTQFLLFLSRSSKARLMPLTLKNVKPRPMSTMPRIWTPKYGLRNPRHTPLRRDQSKIALSVALSA